MRMEPQLPGENIPAEVLESTMSNQALKWFRETQAPIILQEGSFPAWFQGCITRKDAEDRLRGKHLGCFLIRLSDKAIGYILSYKGRDRCRHFVINQNKAGQLIVSGDTEPHDNLVDLIEYYKISPIEPFGEYLTSSCCEPSQSDLYDVVQSNHKETSGISVQAVKSFWDQRNDQAVLRPPPLPPKGPRKLAASASLEKTPLLQAAPPVPKRGSPADKSALHGHIMYAELEKHRPKDEVQLSLNSKGSLRSSIHNRKYCSTPKDEDPCSLSWNFSKSVEAHPTSQPAPETSTVYSELNLSDCRSKSLPILDDDIDQHYFGQSTTSSTPPKVSPNSTKKATCHTVSLLDERGCPRELAALGSPSNSSLERLHSRPLYQLAGTPQWRHDSCIQTCMKPSEPAVTQQEENLYAQVPHESSHMLGDKIYEQIPDLECMGSFISLTSQGNTYETLEDIKQKGAKKSDIWRRFFPEHKKN